LAKRGQARRSGMEDKGSAEPERSEDRQFDVKNGLVMGKRAYQAGPNIKKRGRKCHRAGWVKKKRSKFRLV